MPFGQSSLSSVAIWGNCRSASYFCDLSCCFPRLHWSVGVINHRHEVIGLPWMNLSLSREHSWGMSFARIRVASGRGDSLSQMLWLRFWSSCLYHGQESLHPHTFFLHQFDFLGAFNLDHYQPALWFCWFHILVPHLSLGYLPFFSERPSSGLVFPSVHPTTLAPTCHYWAAGSTGYGRRP